MTSAVKGSWIIKANLAEQASPGHWDASEELRLTSFMLAATRKTCVLDANHTQAHEMHAAVVAIG